MNMYTTYWYTCFIFTIYDYIYFIESAMDA